ncbi:hypothetical protein [Massilia agilis]
MLQDIVDARSSMDVQLPAASRELSSGRERDDALHSFSHVDELAALRLISLSLNIEIVVQSENLAVINRAPAAHQD